MVMRPGDSFSGPSRGNAETAIARLVELGAQGEFRPYVREVYRLCASLPEPVDAAIVVAQACIETGQFTTDYWTRDRNPAGIGIFKEGAPTPIDIPSGADAALIHIAILWHQMHPDPAHADPPALAGAGPLLGRWLDGVKATASDANRPPTRAIADLNRNYTDRFGVPQCTWACDPIYQTKLCERGNLVFRDLAVAGDTVAGTRVSVREDDVRLRSTPSTATDANIINPGMPTGAVVVLTGTSAAPFDPDPERFIAVSAEGMNGWVAARFLAAVVLEGGADLRAAPDATLSVVQRLAEDSVVSLIGEGVGAFLPVVQGGIEGWVHSDALGPVNLIPASPVAGTQVTVRDGDVRLRSGPTTETDANILINAMPAGATLTLTGQTQNGFLGVSFESSVGWVFAEFLHVAVREGGVRFRSSPSTASDENILGEMGAGTTLTLGGEIENGFLGVRRDGQPGWVFAAFLGPAPVGAGPVATGGQGLSAIWGGVGDVPISQEMGPTDFALANPDLYRYAEAYNFHGHPGFDVNTADGTALFCPIAGTVIFGGGTRFFVCDGQPFVPHQGEFRLRVGNTRDELIIGHMRHVAVNANEAVGAGQWIGNSGSENGPHFHVEYREWVGEGVTPSGFRIRDPREMF